MLSRVANSIYWLNRYVERAENYARFISVNVNLSLDLPFDSRQQWESLLTVTAENHVFYLYYEQPTPENVIFFLTFDERNPNSIYRTIAVARENARTIRETISKEMWESLNQLYLDIKAARPTVISDWDSGQVHTFCNRIKNGTQLFHGVVDATITRNEPWHFGRMGRFLERADKTSRFLDVEYFSLVNNSANTSHVIAWAAVLKLASAYNMYRQQYQTLSPEHIVEFLIFEKKFPRSISYNVRQVEASLYDISGRSVEQGFKSKAEKSISKLRADLEFTDVKDIFKTGLNTYLDHFQKKNNDVGLAIQETYFDWN